MMWALHRHGPEVLQQAAKPLGTGISYNPLHFVVYPTCSLVQHLLLFALVLTATLLTAAWLLNLFLFIVSLRVLPELCDEVHELKASVVLLEPLAHCVESFSIGRAHLLLQILVGQSIYKQQQNLRCKCYVCHCHSSVVLHTRLLKCSVQLWA